MLGSSMSISAPNVVLNTAVAKELDEFATELEGVADFDSALHELIRRTIKEHKRIIFNGNGYDDAWLAEAEKRGLLNLPTTADCLPCYTLPKNIELFSKYKVYTETEVHARYEMRLENYAKVLHIEAHTMVSMTRKDILPAVIRYGRELADTIVSKKQAIGLSCPVEEALLAKIHTLTGTLAQALDRLQETLETADQPGRDPQMLANFYRDEVVPAMQTLRTAADDLEVLVAKDLWPFPSYGDMLFAVR